MVVYKATNNDNGKVYIGQTVRPLNMRKVQHIWNANNGDTYHFHNALRKYGNDNFKWDVIYRTNKLDNLNRMEGYMIIFYNSMDREVGYNCTSGGNNCFYSEELKKKLSEAQRGEKNHNYGKTPTNKTKKKISDAVSGDKNGFYGRKHSQESIEKMKKSHQNMSDKTKKQMSVSQKKRYKNPNEIERVRNSRLGTKASEKTKQKMSNSHLKRWAKIKEKENANV